jgi:hypothetical protein
VRLSGVYKHVSNGVHIKGLAIVVHSAGRTDGYVQIHPC